MRKALQLIPLIVLFYTAPLVAQESYTFSANTTQQARVESARVVQNKNTCARFSLAADCTQQDVCTAAGVTPCNQATAAAAGIEIYATGQAGRERFLLRVIVVPGFLGFEADARQIERSGFCAWWKTADTTDKNSVCTLAGLSAGCEVCN